jgi:PAS domain-containing protein
MAASMAPSAKHPVTFEFTKRKRWADLLMKELADAIILVLSPTRKVLYCGTAVTELLGWKDEELIDGDLMDLINGAHLIFR